MVCKSVKSRCEFCGCCLLSQGTVLLASSLYNRRHSWQHCPPHLRAEFIYLPLLFQCIKGNDYFTQYSRFILKSECIFFLKKSYLESLPCIDYSLKRGESPTVVTDHSQSSLLNNSYSANFSCPSLCILSKIPRYFYLWATGALDTCSGILC